MTPTRVRFAILAVATANAFLLYLDRICMSAVVQSASFQQEMGLDKLDAGRVISSFFLAYALGQCPAGWLADRFGPRRMVALYVFAWSLCTALTGFVGSFTTLLAVRFACGLAEAGAYPASALLITRWFPFRQRARANGTVSFGGRAGNSLALWLTAAAIGALGAWRPVMWIYGVGGIVLAALTWIVFRDYPSEHPWANDAERELIAADAPPPVKQPAAPWWALVRHKGLWMLNAGSLGMNVGWAFLITWLPTYLQEVRGMDRLTASRDVSLALVCGPLGMLFGGWWCDFLTNRYGGKWGRRLPVLIGSSLAISCYLVCPWLPSGTAVVLACAMVTFAVDSIGPAIWAFGQDIGGRHAASTLAWSNMWGNFGATAIASLIPWVLKQAWHQPDWREVFWLCASGFVLLGVSSLFVDATKPLAE